MDTLRDEIEKMFREYRENPKSNYSDKDRFFIDYCMSIIENEKAKQREDLQQDIRSVYHQLKGSTERFKIANYVEKYLLETGEKESK